MEPQNLEQLAHFFTHSIDLFAVADTNGYFRVLNPAWERILGYTMEELIARPYLEFVHPEDVNATIQEQHSLDGGAPTLNFQNRYRAKDGTWHWLSWRATPQPDGHIYAVARDITAQVEDERATKSLLRRLEQSNQELDQFAFVVSHDLKSPLRSIINLSEWIREDMGTDLPEDVAEHIDLLQRRAGRMQQLIDDLLRYAKTAREDLPPERVPLENVFREVLDGLSLPPGFIVRAKGPLPTIKGSNSELYLVLQNLISNGVKYRSSDNGWVEVSVTEAPSAWEIVVRDNGLGIDPKHHQRVFGMFQRLADEDVEGTGVGLAVVKKILDRIGGSVRVESEEGKGAIFTIFWPKL